MYAKELSAFASRVPRFEADKKKRVAGREVVLLAKEVTDTDTNIVVERSIEFAPENVCPATNSIGRNCPARDNTSRRTSYAR